MELLKLLIADDEANIRNGLKCILDWGECGYKICGEASNGKDAVSQIIDLRPDLVILDIKMPGLTGIEVISQIKDYFESNNLEVPSFIILSGFSDFEYAQKTVNKGAKAYLLKPVDEDELQAKVIEIAGEIKNRRYLKESSKNAQVLEINSYLLNLVHSKNIPELNKLSTARFFSDFQTSDFSCILIDTTQCQNTNREDILKSLDNYFSFFNRVILEENKKILIFLNASNENAIINCIERTTKLNNKRTFICKSRLYKGLEGIKSAYEEVVALSNYIFYISDLSYISSDNIQKATEEVSPSQINKLNENILFCIETYNKSQLETILTTIQTSFFNINKSEAEVKKLFISLLVELKNKLKTKYPEREIQEVESFDIIPKVLEAKSYSEIINLVNDMLFSLVESFNFNTADSVIVKVIAYVKSNYSSDLKLEVLGDMFNCNSAYLGKKFKKYTGEQFNTYLDNLRIEDAKDKLLNTDLKIYQISKLVGYSNTDYFFMKFKKCTGYTPKEYKKVIESEKK